MNARFLSCIIVTLLFILTGPPARGQGLPPSPAPEIAEPRGPITLTQALALVLARSPELEGYDWEIRAAEARLLQAGALPNPELEAEIENFGGKEQRVGFRSADSTLRISQLIELGAKRSRRMAAADQERLLTLRDYEAKRLDLVAETSRSFVDVLVAQSRVTFAENSATLGSQMLDAAVERIRAGRASPLEENRARVVHSTARLELERARRNLDAARRRLAILWGNTAPLFSAADGRLDELVAATSPDELLRQASASPDATRWANEIELRKANVDVEKSKAIPDVTLQGGIRRFADTDDNALIVGFSLPIPVFNTNRGSIQEAGTKLNKAYVDQRAAQQRIEAAVVASHNALMLAASETEIMTREIIPGAEQTFTAAQESYRLGRFSFLEFLDAQRTLTETRARQIEILADYQKAVIDIERLSAVALRRAAR